MTTNSRLPTQVLRSADGRAVRCGHRLGSYDSVVAGELYATKPHIFAVLSRLFATPANSPTIADAMQERTGHPKLSVQ